MSTSKPPRVVAVVEDDPAARTALGRLLWAGGFAPVLFESAEACLEAQPDALCIVLDVRLRGMSGIELQQRLRALAPAHPPPDVSECAPFSWEDAINGGHHGVGVEAFPFDSHKRFRGHFP